MYNQNVNLEDYRERVIQDLAGKNWLAAFLLLVTFGIFGAHRFYTGKTGTGIVMLVLTLCIITCPISFIWAVVDFLALTFDKFKHADGDDLYESVNWLGYIVIAWFVLIFVIAFMQKG